MSGISGVLRTVLMLRVAQAGRWSAEEFPDPRSDTDRCGHPPQPSWVCDPTRTLSTQEAFEVSMMMDYLGERTGPCVCPSCHHQPWIGYKASLAIIDTLNNTARGTSERAAKATGEVTTFANTLRTQRWTYGICDDDLLILILLQDRMIYTSVGKTTSLILTEACIKEIETKHRAAMFASGHYASHVKEIIQEYTMVLEGKHTCYKAKGSLTYSIVGSVVVVIIIVLAVAVMVGGSSSFCAGPAPRYSLVPGRWIHSTSLLVPMVAHAHGPAHHSSLASLESADYSISPDSTLNRTIEIYV